MSMSGAEVATVPVTILKQFVYIDSGERKVAVLGSRLLVPARILRGLVEGKFVQDDSQPPAKPAVKAPK